MGQMTVGILLGCEAPALPVTGDDPEPLYDLICRWEGARRITLAGKEPKVRVESEGGKDLLGVWVAVGGGGEDGAPYFTERCMPLADVPNACARSIARAEKLWYRFAAWAEKHEGLKLPLPRLWL